MTTLSPSDDCVLADIDAIHVGDSATCEVTLDAGTIASFAALSADVNPLHVNADAAHAYGFQKPVAHGMLALAAVSRLIGTQLPGGGSLWVEQTIRFPSPAFEGDTIVVSVTVEKVSPGTGMVVLRTEAVNTATSAAVLTGRACVSVRRPHDPRRSSVTA